MKTQQPAYSKLELVFHSVWGFLAQLASEWGHSTTPEPEIHKVTDQGCLPWWYVREPLTGELTYLESETEVERWIEERFRRWH